MKTIKQIADNLGIDKQKVYRYIRKNHIDEVHQKNGAMYLNDTIVEDIFNHFANQTVSIDSTDTVIETLKKELNIKNKQIESMQKNINDLTSALIESQQNIKNTQALHAGTIKQNLIENESFKKKESIFRKLFYRK